MGIRLAVGLSYWVYKKPCFFKTAIFHQAPYLFSHASIVLSYLVSIYMFQLLLLIFMSAIRGYLHFLEQNPWPLWLLPLGSILRLNRFRCVRLDQEEAHQKFNQV